MIEWMATDNEWSQATEVAAWATQHQDNQLLVYGVGREWCWRVTLPDGFTMSGIRVKTLGEAFKAAEDASWRFYDARQPEGTIVPDSQKFDAT